MWYSMTSDKKIELIKKIENALEKSEAEFVVDNTLKNTIIFTDNDTGQKLIAKCKFENDNLVFESIDLLAEQGDKDCDSK